MSGCVSDPAPAPPNALDLLAQGAGASGPSMISGLSPLGLVPYDGLVLPLVSPDAAFAATHFGAAPSWPALLGAPGAAPPELTAVRIYALSERGARSTATVAEAVVLGRGVDREGFLVEAPREDGSRWIGRVPWSARGIVEPDWLIDDGHVNAFATFGPDGTLAWSRRHPGEDRFSLMLIRGDRCAVVPRGADETWLLPSFSADGRRLFALVLRDTELLLAMIVPESLGWVGLPQGARGGLALPAANVLHRDLDEEARSSPAHGHPTLGVTSYPLARDCTVQSAWQAVAFAQGWPVEPARPPDDFLVFHPTERRLAVWQAEHGTLLLLPSGSLAAVFLDARTLLLALADRAVVQSLAIAETGRIGSSPRPLANGVHVPRGLAGPDMPAILMSPQRGSVTLMGVRLRREGEVEAATVR